MNRHVGDTAFIRADMGSCGGLAGGGGGKTNYWMASRRLLFPPLSTRERCHDMYVWQKQLGFVVRHSHNHSLQQPTVGPSRNPSFGGSLSGPSRRGEVLRGLASRPVNGGASDTKSGTLVARGPVDAIIKWARVRLS